MKIYFQILLFAIILSSFYSVKIFPQQGLVKSYYPNGALQSEINYSSNVRDGLAKFYYPNGKLNREINYTEGRVEGVVKEYYENGNVKEIYEIVDGKRSGIASFFELDGKNSKNLTFENGKLISEDHSVADTSVPKGIDTLKQTIVQNNQIQNEDRVISKKVNTLKNETVEVSAPPVINEKHNEKYSEYFDTADVIPAPIGGMRTIMNKLVYPLEAINDNIVGTVKIRAFVDELGEVTQDEVVQGIGHGCDEAAKIAVYYTRFVPGIIKGKPVKTQVIIPIEFKLTSK
jgi:TonB family protein